MFGCPKCGSTIIIQDDPEALLMIWYDKDGNEKARESITGGVFINPRCAECETPYNKEIWNHHEKE